ncbi:MAG: TonB-dependent receptor plug domain-containing protein [Rhodothermales bacterium]|nr:TonB-dependent receptor plug domain-containing protein [Rhodothermales bacterium]
MTRLLLCIALLLTASASAQTPADSLREYDLEELVVSTSNAPGTFETVRMLGLADLARVVPTAADAAIAYLPSARVQTNSRGESIVYLRNSGERQVAVFLDGAPLNVAWDNRVDLSLVPSGAIGRVSVISGPSSVLLGTNITGGAVELISRLAESGQSIELDASIGSLGFVQGGVKYSGSVAGWRASATIEYAERNGLTLSGGPALRFNQIESDRRTNSDWQLANVHLRAARKVSDTFELGVTVLGNRGAKGIAPESHIDPSDGGARYWRYPETDRALLIISGQSRSTNWNTQSSAWIQRSSQRIDQYSTPLYATLSDRQDDLDESYGARLVSEYGKAAGTIRLSGTYTANRHRQEDGLTDASVVRRFRQDVFSVGAEYESDEKHKTVFRFGTSLDGYHAPSTGISGSNGTGVSLSGGIRRQLSANTSLRVGAARKNRFPTARESQDTGLGRFVLNPELKQETALLLEAAFEADIQNISAAVVPFAQRTSDTIDQIRIQVDSLSLRQRVNLDDSRVLGVELLANTTAASRLQVSGSLTLMHARGKSDGESRKLTERPAVLFSTSAALRIGRGINASSQIRYYGRAFGMDERGDLVPLRKAAILDAKLSYTTYLSQFNLGIQTYLRVENLLDTPSTAQLGLPGPGRFLRVGLSATL